ncbi:hypothetical protein LSTR_LSTR006938 [Laodelphax striatellus]|uniref:Ubiquitin-like protease family profile domain-containing protein n=1 Tax=Laodelphax striatellus TaxID=195883 RepID=A0A482X385_LAOST|nr:hypothetical protein LSTR_LSTR006938 [Laodelphax striatellus]
MAPMAERCRKSYQSTKKKTKVTDADIINFKLPSQVAAQAVQQAKQLNQQSSQLNQQSKPVFQLKQTGVNLLPPVTATVLPAGLSQAITLITNQNKLATTPNSSETLQSTTTSGETQINIPFQPLPENKQTIKIIVLMNEKKFSFEMDESTKIAEALQKAQAGCSNDFSRFIAESILRQVAKPPILQEVDGKVGQTAGQPTQPTENDEEGGEASSQDSSPSPSKSETGNYQEGKMALCHQCGFCSPSYDFCTRCKAKLPPDVKSICLNRVPVTMPELQSNVVLKRTSEVAVAVADSPKKRQKVSKKKKVEEPVCLTISSDDEDANDSNVDPAITQSAMLKEPVITDEEGGEEAVKDGEYHDPMEEDEQGECDMDSSETDSEWPVALDCRTVRIGSYKVPPNDRVYITLRGIYITIPAIVCENVKIGIPWESIVKILAHFGKGMPVIFIYTTAPMGAKIRKMLGMTDKNNFPYYDPASANESQRRITLLPENISNDCNDLLKKLFLNLERTEYEELSQNEANDILVRASPKEVQNQVQKAVVNTTPRLPNEIQTIMVYPPPPAKGGIPINTEDYACLGEDQFLNDVIIDFYLKYLHQHYLSEKDQSRTHILSTFFYKRLTTKPTSSRRSLHNPVENDPKASAAEKRHSRVKSWTKHVDIFNKDFIIIPINEHSHWFLAVICFPGLTGAVDFDTNQPIDVATDAAKVATAAAAKKQADSSGDKVGGGKSDMMAGKTSLVIGSTTITALGGAAAAAGGDTVTLLQSEEEDRDEADGDDEDFDQASSEEEAPPLQQDTDNSTVKSEIDENKEPEQNAQEPVQESPEAVKEEKLRRSKRKEPRMPIKQPCILIFDSLATASRAKVVATLRDYLKVEYKVKHGVERQFTKEYMKGASPKVPQQTNYTDCGLYVLQYVEAFFEAPITDYHIPIKTLQEWFDVDIVSRKRFDIQQLLHKLMGEQGIDFSTLNLPDLNLAPFHHGLVDYPDSDEEMLGEEEEEEEEDYQEYGEAYRAMCEDARFNGYREEEDEEDEDEDDERRLGVEDGDEEMDCDGGLEDEEEEEEDLDEEEEDCEEEEEKGLERVMCEDMDKELLDEMVPSVVNLKSFRLSRLNQRDDIKLNQSISIVRTGSVSDNNCDSRSTSDNKH